MSESGNAMQTAVDQLEIGDRLAHTRFEHVLSHLAAAVVHSNLAVALTVREIGMASLGPIERALLAQKEA